MAKKMKFSWGIVFLLLSAVLVNGCQTAKGIAYGAVDGINKDSRNVWKFMQDADSWMKENLW